MELFQELLEAARTSSSEKLRDEMIAALKREGVFNPKSLAQDSFFDDVTVLKIGIKKLDSSLDSIRKVLKKLGYKPEKPGSESYHHSSSKEIKARIQKDKNLIVIQAPKKRGDKRLKDLR